MVSFIWKTMTYRKCPVSSLHSRSSIIWPQCTSPLRNYFSETWLCLESMLWSKPRNGWWSPDTVQRKISWGRGQSADMGIKFCDLTSFVTPNGVTLGGWKCHLIFLGLNFLICITKSGSMISLFSHTSEFLDFMIPGYHHLKWGQSPSQELFIRLLTIWGRYRGSKPESIGPWPPCREAGPGCIWVQVSFCPKSVSASNFPLFWCPFFWVLWALGQRVPPDLLLGGPSVCGLPAAFDSSEKWVSYLWCIYLPGPSSHHIHSGQRYLARLISCPAPLCCWLLWLPVSQCDSDVAWERNDQPFLRASLFLSLLGLPLRNTIDWVA